jgi:hypothetical protein
MVKRDGAETRKERIEQIARKIMAELNKEEEISLSKTISEIEYEFGLTKEKTMEYMKILQDLGRFIIDEDNDKIKKATES